MNTRLSFKEIEFTDKGLLIKKASIIDGNTGEELRIAKLTPELTDFLLKCEIVIDDYVKIKQMQEKNESLKNICDTFKLYK